ncbi:MAG: hypothetical protein DRP78_05290 [Candidatus Omnitrophota bacterium]|nr:MAG: hypothetical protein DRP78_05290 [Candidatus Omnitrophota bacterium]
MENIFKFFINRKILVNIIITLLIIFGIMSLKKIPREGMPAIDLNQVSITTIYPGASAQDVELNVTIPIEDHLRNVDGIEEITSTSMENSSSILIQIDESMGGKQTDFIKDEIQKEIDSIDDLPDTIKSKPIVSEIVTGDIPIIEIALSHKNKSYLRDISLQLEKNIEKLDGVAGVEKVGYFDQEIHVEVDPTLMNNAYFSLPEVVTSIQKRNLRTTAGTLESYKGLKNIIILNKFKNPLEVADVILRSNFEQKQISLKEISEVKLTEEDNHLIVRNNGEIGISLLVRKKNAADIIRTIKSVQALVKEKIPKEIKYTYVNDQSKTTKTRLKLLINNGIIGFILVLLFLFFFLNKKAALWTSFGIPFCFIAAFSFFPLFNLTLSAIALSGLLIVIGIIVDDAIVISEKTTFYQESGLEPRKASLKAVMEMAAPVTTAALTTIFAYLPIFYLSGKIGKFVKAIPLIVIIILVISLFESFFVLPNHLAHGKNKKSSKPEWMIFLEKIYKNILVFILKFRYMFMLLLLTAFAVSILLAGKYLKVQMFPQSNINTFFIKIETPNNFNLEKTQQVTQELEQLIAKLPKDEVASYISRIGHQSTSKTKNFGDHENWAIITVFLTPDSERKRYASQIIKELKSKYKPLKGIKVVFDKQKIGAIKDKPVTIHLSSNDRNILIAAEKKTLTFLKKMKTMGVSDLDSNRKQGKDELVVDIDHKKMAALGITTADVAQILKIAYEGEIVTSIQTVDQEIDYRVILNNESRKDLNILNELGIKNKAGALIKLKNFISFKNRTSDLSIYHRNGVRSITISAEIASKKISALESAKYIQTNLIDTWDIPDSLEYELGGEYKKTKEILKDVKTAALIAVLLIFCVLAVLLDSWTLPLTIMSVIPFSIIGVIFALLTHGQNISMFVLLAVISLSGVVVNDSIVMVNTLNKNLAGRGNNKDFLLRIAEFSKTRLRPILLTTLTTLAGLLPMAYGWGGYEKMLSPMSLAFSWGLLFATIITLFLIPCLYMAINDLTLKFGKKRVHID